jgi:hypothetical protein
MDKTQSTTTITWTIPAVGFFRELIEIIKRPVLAYFIFLVSFIGWPFVEALLWGWNMNINEAGIIAQSNERAVWLFTGSRIHLFLILVLFIWVSIRLMPLFNKLTVKVTTLWIDRKAR